MKNNCVVVIASPKTDYTDHVPLTLSVSQLWA